MRPSTVGPRSVPVVVLAVCALVLAAVGTAAAQTTTTPTTKPTGTPPAPRPHARAARCAASPPRRSRSGASGTRRVYGGADIGAKARFQRANDAGGVNGRKIDYIGFADDGGDPTAGSTAATKLVEQDGVFAVVPTVTPDLAASGYLVSRRSRTSGGRCRRTSAATPTASGSPAVPCPANATSNALADAHEQGPAQGRDGKAVAIVAENTPSGQYDAQRAQRRGEEREVHRRVRQAVARVAGRRRLRPRSPRRW